MQNSTAEIEIGCKTLPTKANFELNVMELKSVRHQQMQILHFVFFFWNQDCVQSFPCYWDMYLATQTHISALPWTQGKELKFSCLVVDYTGCNKNSNTLYRVAYDVNKSGAHVNVAWNKTEHILGRGPTNHVTLS